MTLRLTKAQRTALHGMFGGRCAYCGEVLAERWHADHFIAIERKFSYGGGKVISTGESWKPENDTIENFRPSCAPCNISKGPLTIESWRSWLLGHVAALNAHNTPYRLVRKYGLVEETGRPIVFYFERATTGNATADDGKDK